MKAKFFQSKFLKVVNIASLIFSMMVAPTSLAQGLNPPNSTAAAVGSIIQQATLAGLAGMQQALPVGAGGVTKVPSKIFPTQCQVLPARTNLPVNACEGELSTGGGGFAAQLAAMQQSSQAQSIAQMARSKQLSIEAMINLDSNNPNTTDGLACLNREKKELDDKFVKKMQELEALIGRIDANNQTFIEQNEARVSAMADNGYLLYGQNFRGKANTAHLKMKDAFSAACREVIGLDNLGDPQKSGGIQGMNEAVMVPASQSASIYQRNKSQYEAEIKSQVTQIKKDLKEFGLNSVNEGRSSFAKRGQQNYEAIKAVWEEQYAEFLRKYQSYNQLMQDYTNQNLPELNHAFETEVERMTKVLTENFTKSHIDNCVNQEMAALGLDSSSLEKNRDSLQYLPTNNRGTAIDSYRTQLQTILNSDMEMTAKIEEIRLLDERMGNNVQMNISAYNGSNGSVTPYQLYQQSLSVCQDRLAQPQSDGSLSIQERIDEAQKIVNDLKNDKDKFIKNIDDEILDSVINCSGATMAAGACTVGGASNLLDPGGSNFCIAHASQCSTNINACHQETEDVIKVKKDHSAILAEEYNNNMVALINLQNQVAQQVQANILSLAEMVNQMIPGTAWEFQGETLAITAPKPELVAELGVHLRGGGDFESIDQLKERIKNLQALMQDQRKKVSDEIKDYIKLQETNMVEALGDWQELADKCDDQIARAQAAQAEQMAQQQAAADEANQFCNDYRRAANQPSCGNVSVVAGASLQAAGGLVGQNQRVAQSAEYDYCNTENREPSNGEDPPSDKDAYVSLVEACQDNNQDFSRVRTVVINDFQNSIPEQLSSQRSIILSYVNGTREDLPQAIQNHPFFNSHIRDMRSALNIASQTDLNHYVDSPSREDALDFLRGNGDLSGVLTRNDLDLPTIMGQMRASTPNVPSNQNDNYCIQLRIDAAINSYESQIRNRDIASLTDTDEHRRSFASNISSHYTRTLEGSENPNNNAQRVANGIARAGLEAPTVNVTTSNSGAIGQRLRDVPCTAMQGAGNFNSGRGMISTQDTNILGAGNTSGLIIAE